MHGRAILLLLAVVAGVALVLNNSDGPTSLLGDGIDEYLGRKYGATAVPSFAVFAKRSRVRQMHLSLSHALPHGGTCMRLHSSYVYICCRLYMIRTVGRHMRKDLLALLHDVRERFQRIVAVCLDAA